MDISYSFAMLCLNTDRRHAFRDAEGNEMKANYQTRALMLFLRLNQQAMLYTPLSHRGLRAKRIMQRLAVRMS